MSATQTRSDQLQPEMLQTMRDLGLADEVLESRSLLHLEVDWDDEGSPGYGEATWNRAVDFLLRIATHWWNQHQLHFSSVEIMPGSYGNIDLELRTSRARLLLSFPPDPSHPVRYYAHDETKTRVAKGTLDPVLPNAWLIEWLAE